MSIRWFHKLNDDGRYKESLKKCVNKWENKFIVSKQTENMCRMFACFAHHSAFIDYYANCSESERVLYEVISGQQKQKIYFDLDIEPISKISLSESIILVNQLKKAILEEIPESNEENILVFSSNGSTIKEGDKISYHIVLDGFYVKSHLHNKYICERIKNRIDEKFKSVVDMLYSSLQQFRMLSSHKIGKEHKKKQLCKDLTSWTPKREKRLHNIELMEASFITFTYECKLLNIEIEEKKIIKVNNGVNLTNDEYTKLNDLVEDKLGGAFRLLDNGGKSSLFQLRRISKCVECIKCKRPHDNEQGYVRVAEDGSVYFYCYRDETKESTLIGALPIRSMFDIDVIVDKKDTVTVKSEETNSVVKTTSIPNMIFSFNKPSLHNILNSTASEKKNYHNNNRSF